MGDAIIYWDAKRNKFVPFHLMPCGAQINFLMLLILPLLMIRLTEQQLAFLQQSYAGISRDVRLSIPNAQAATVEIFFLFRNIQQILSKSPNFHEQKFLNTFFIIQRFCMVFNQDYKFSM